MATNDDKKKGPEIIYKRSPGGQSPTKPENPPRRMVVPSSPSTSEEPKPPTRPSKTKEELARLKADREAHIAKGRKPAPVVRSIPAIEQNYQPFNGVKMKIAVRVLADDSRKGPEGEARGSWIIPRTRTDKMDVSIPGTSFQKDHPVIPMFVKGLHSITKSTEGKPEDDKFMLVLSAPEIKPKKSYNIDAWYENFSEEERNIVIKAMSNPFLEGDIRERDDNDQPIKVGHYYELREIAKAMILNYLKKERYTYPPDKQEELFKILSSTFGGLVENVKNEQKQRKQAELLNSEPNMRWTTKYENTLYVPTVVDQTKIYLEEYDETIHQGFDTSGELQFVEEEEQISIQIPTMNWCIKKNKDPKRMDHKFNLKGFGNLILRKYFPHLLPNKESVLNSLPNEKMKFYDFRTAEQIIKDLFYDASKQYGWVQYSKEQLFKQGFAPTQKNWLKSDDFKNFVAGNQYSPIEQEHMMSRSTRSFLKGLLKKLKTNNDSSRETLRELIDTMDTMFLNYQDTPEAERYLAKLNAVLGAIRKNEKNPPVEKTEQKVVEPARAKIFTKLSDDEKQMIAYRASDDELDFSATETAAKGDYDPFDSYLEAKTSEHDKFQDDLDYNDIYDQYEQYDLAESDILEAWIDFRDEREGELDEPEIRLQFMNLIEELEAKVEKRKEELEVQSGRVSAKELELAKAREEQERIAQQKSEELKGMSRLKARQKSNAGSAKLTDRRNYIRKAIDKFPFIKTNQEIIDLTNGQGLTRDWIDNTRDLDTFEKVKEVIKKIIDSKAKTPLEKLNEWLLLLSDVI